MNEQTLYKGLLEGAIIGSVNYADKLATLYAKMINNSEVSKKNYHYIYEKIILAYGDILEENEEEELRLILEKWDAELIVRKLKTIEESYSAYFLEVISEGREKIEIIYQEVTSRIGTVSFDLTEVKNIKKAESLQDIDLAGKVWKKIVENDNFAAWELYENTYSSVVHYVKNNNGNNEESDDIWNTAFLEFREKLNKLTNQDGYYKWQGTKKNQEDKANLMTFFILICQRRWLDKLRQLNRISQKQGDILKEFYQEADTDTVGEYNNQEYLKDRIKKAVVILKGICQEIINGKWFGGEFGERISSKELALAIGYSKGYINNQHPKCLDDLKIILQNQKSLLK
jgi:DNA-directed RNA polymerase specialized sigma24 family protein